MESLQTGKTKRALVNVRFKINSLTVFASYKHFKG